MRTGFKSRMHHSLIAAIAIGSLLVAGGTSSVRADSPVATPPGGTSITGDSTTPQPAVGSDLTEFDTPSAKFTQLANGLIGVRLYAARVGINDPAGWRFRNPQLGTVGVDGTVAPLDEPFALHIATTAGAPALATLTDENKVSLAIRGVTAGGSPLATGTGAISPTAVQFVSGVPAAASLAVESTISGLVLQVQVQRTPQAGALSVQLDPGAGLALVSRPDGTIVAQTTETRYGDDGVTPYQSYDPHFVIAAPLVEDASGVAAPATAASLRAATGPDGKPRLTIGVDPAWLADPARVYPVHITLHVDTALSLVDAGRTSSTTTCPGRTVQGTSLARVGTLAGCTSTTQVYFDTSQIPPRTNIQQATLQVASFSPLAASAMQVQDEHSGAAAPALAASGATSVPGLAPSTALTWDATTIVQQWVQHTSPDEGLRLSSTGSQAQLASLETARTAPQLVPALNLVVNPNPIPLVTESGPGNMYAPAVAGIGDGAPFIYGAAGTFEECGQTDGHICPDITTALAAVQGHPGNYCNGQVGICNGFGGSFIRFTVYLPCPGTGANWSGAYALMSAAYSRQQQYNAPLIPIVDFAAPQQNPNGGSQCGSIVQPSQWFTLLQGFAQGAPSLPHVYFEIGNEEDYSGASGYYGDYNQVFFAASAGLYWNLPSGSFPFYRILVGGMLNAKGAGCSNNTLDSANGWVAYTYSHTYPGYPRPIRSVVGLGVHPYGYTASDTGFYNSPAYAFPNENFGANACTGIDAVVKYANSASAPSLNNLPIIMTEVNANTLRFPPSDQADITRQGNLDAAYLTDLFSYLYDRCGFASFGCTTGPIIPANSPLRVMWFRGNDENLGSAYDASGIYTTSGADKIVPALNRCPGQKTSPTGQTLAHTYYYLRNGNCW